jgi:hypothetical protein
MEADSTVNRFVDVDELYNETYGGGEQWVSINNKLLKP